MTKSITHFIRNSRYAFFYAKKSKKPRFYADLA